MSGRALFGLVAVLVVGFALVHGAVRALSADLRDPRAIGWTTPPDTCGFLAPGETAATPDAATDVDVRTVHGRSLMQSRTRYGWRFAIGTGTRASWDTGARLITNTGRTPVRVYGWQTRRR